MNEWISVKDRLPENEDEVLICAYNTELKIQSTIVDSYNGYGCWTNFNMEYNEKIWKVTHWMPLPVAPPKETDVATLEERVEKVIKLCNKKMHRFDILSKVATTCGRLEDFKKNFDLFMIYGNIKGILEGEIEIDEC